MKSLKMKAAAVLTVLGLVSAPAVANDAVEYARQVTNVLLATGNYVSVHDDDNDENDRIDANDSVYESYTFTKGKKYYLYATCDNDCSDLDLALLDRSDNTIGTDYEMDDAPVIEFTAPYSGKYRVRIDMEDCSTDYCYYSLRALMEK